jgi:hypothetical protein
LVEDAAIVGDDPAKLTVLEFTVKVPDPKVTFLLVVVLIPSVPVPDRSITGLAPVRFTNVEAKADVAPETVIPPLTVVVLPDAPIASVAAAPPIFKVVAFVLNTDAVPVEEVVMLPPVTARFALIVTSPDPKNE